LKLCCVYTHGHGGATPMHVSPLRAAITAAQAA